MPGRTRRKGAEEPAPAPAEPAEPENGKLTAAQKKRLKKKQREAAKKAERQQQQQQLTAPADDKPAPRRKKAGEEDVEIEYVTAPLDVVLAEALPNAAAAADADAAPEALAELTRIMNHFAGVEEPEAAPEGAADAAAAPEDEAMPDAPPPADADAAEASSDDEGGAKAAGLSKKKRREAARAKVAELKQESDRPEVVEIWDVTAADPSLLVHLKAYRNTVPVPRHWSQKRKYLQGKRGLEKPPFKLPAFIEATGIAEMRQAYLEKADSQKMKAKGRERMAPKMGKLDIDYQVLHDAFFRHQTKPALSGHGDLYYEGKEYEASVRHARPGVISSELQAALEIPPGGPPPWLVAMQRYGPPPSYPSLRIPGLNAPIPSGAHFGYHTGGWGKPPVDEYGNPIYGDVFNQGKSGGGGAGGGSGGAWDDDDAGPRVTAHWGDLEELESEEESEEEEEEEEEGGEEEEEEEEAAFVDGTASVASTIPGGLETPVEVQLRKQAEEHAAKAPTAPKQLYTVLEQQKAGVGGAGIMGSDHLYVVPGTEKGAPGGGAGDKKVSLAAAKRLEALRREMPSDVDIAIDPADLEALDDESLKDLYESRVREARAAAGREDFSDLVAAKSAATTAKRKAADRAGGKEKKFKF